MTDEVDLDIYFPKKLKGLFVPNRYKVAYGGRASAKSWSFARALLIIGVQKSLRVICAREVQKSIKESVHALLSDQIQALGMGADYQVIDTEIRGPNGTKFAFTGLAQHTIESIKGYEGYDICWVEEAQTVSKKSWQILIPTIRKPDSEIWVSFNPDLDTDDTYVRFVENPPDGAMVVRINYSDNKRFPAVLEKERLHCKKHNPKDYMNIWEGLCKSAVDGAIYADEIAKAQQDRQITRVPYDPMLKVHVVFDLGWNDSMFISLVQKGVSDIRVIESIEDSHKTLAHYSTLLKEKRLNWGKVFLPHDGAAKDFKTGKSSQEILRAMGWDVEIIPMHGIEEGIKVARLMFSRTYFDKEKTVPMINALKRYRRAINSKTGAAGSPLHDDASHGADNFRYIAMSQHRMKNDKQEFYGYINNQVADSIAGY